MLTIAQQKAYRAVLEAAARTQSNDFLSYGFIVADLSQCRARNHGGFRAAVRGLMRKGYVYPLNPARSHTQRYLIGCVYGNRTYYHRWLQEMLQRFLAAPAWNDES